MVTFDIKQWILYWTRVYNHNEISIVLTKNEMKKLLTLCTRSIHLTLNNEIHVQNDGVAMGSPLGLILGNIFLVKLENTLVLRLHQHVNKWNVKVNHDN